MSASEPTGEKTGARDRLRSALEADLRVAFNAGWEAAEWSVKVPSHNPADTRARRMDDNFTLLVSGRLSAVSPSASAGREQT